MSFIHILEQSYNLLYSFSILLAIAIWGLSTLGLVGNGAESTEGLALQDTNLPEVSNHFSLFDSMADMMGVGTVPSSILTTLLLFFTGLVGISLNEWLISLVSPQSFFYYALLVANFFVALVSSFGFTSMASRPLRYLFKDYGKTATSDSFVGKSAKVSSGKVNQHSGQATVQLADGNIIEVAVRLIDDKSILNYGQSVLIIDFDKEKNIYWVQGLEQNE
jgi:Protein of unknown function (DUF1449)